MRSLIRKRVVGRRSKGFIRPGINSEYDDDDEYTEGELPIGSGHVGDLDSDEDDPLIFYGVDRDGITMYTLIENRKPFGFGDPDER